MNKITLALAVILVVYTIIGLSQGLFTSPSASSCFVVTPDWVVWVPLVLAVIACVGFFVSWHFYKPEDSTNSLEQAEPSLT